jgi:hypothetical protein
MHAQAKDWKHAVDRLWADAIIDLRAAAQLAAEMARGEDAALREVAAQALPSLRAALVKGADQRTRDVARRRFGAVRNVLHSLDAPRFGKRGTPAEVLTADERNRHMLGLPCGRRLYGPEIREAYKRAAKTMHPDGGGSEQAFRELSAARDALLRGGER